MRAQEHGAVDLLGDRSKRPGNELTDLTSVVLIAAERVGRGVHNDEPSLEIERGLENVRMKGS